MDNTNKNIKGFDTSLILSLSYSKGIIGSESLIRTQRALDVGVSAGVL